MAQHHWNMMLFAIYVVYAFRGSSLIEGLKRHVFCGVLYIVPVLHTRHNCGATLHFIFWLKPFWFWHQLSLVGSKLLRLFCQRRQTLKYFMPQVIPKGKQMGQWWGWGGVICFVFKGAWLESPLYIAWGTSEWPTIAQILSVCMHYILHPTTPC